MWGKIRCFFHTLLFCHFSQPISTVSQPACECFHVLWPFRNQRAKAALQLRSRGNKVRDLREMKAPSGSARFEFDHDLEKYCFQAKLSCGLLAGRRASADFVGTWLSCLHGYFRILEHYPWSFSVDAPLELV